MLTGIVYTSSDIEIDYTNDAYSIVAKKDLPVGHLVLIEHVLHGDINILLNGVLTDQNLFDQLYPRQFQVQLDEFQQAIEKTESNCFMFRDGHVLGNILSKFNHSCKPNCHLDIIDFVNTDKFYGTWTHRKVSKGDELTFDYVNKGDVQFHESMKENHHFTCDCTESYILANDQRSKVHVNLGTFFRNRDNKLIHRLVDAYRESSYGQIVIRMQNKLKNELQMRLKKGDVQHVRRSVVGR
jgi:hypothetical protein